MIALLQRVTRARVTVDDRETGAIGSGLMALVCAEPPDTAEDAKWLADRLLRYRVFSDERGRMNLSLNDLAERAASTSAPLIEQAGLLLVPQFTLAADTRSGLRPSFSGAASPELGREMFNHFVTACRATHNAVATGEFGADMQVELVNNGPVTFWLQNRRSA